MMIRTWVNCGTIILVINNNNDTKIEYDVRCDVKRDDSTTTFRFLHNSSRIFVRTSTNRFAQKTILRMAMTDTCTLYIVE